MGTGQANSFLWAPPALTFSNFCTHTLPHNQVNIPDWIVELRHELTHKKMPHINDCRRGESPGNMSVMSPESWIGWHWGEREREEGLHLGSELGLR